MNIKDELEQDIAQFFKQIDNQLPENKRKTLKLLIDKYCHLNSSSYLMDKSDFDMIKQHSQKFLLNRDFPKVMGENRRWIGSDEVQALSIIEGTISYLKGKGCFNREPKFDYKEK